MSTEKISDRFHRESLEGVDAVLDRMYEAVGGVGLGWAEALDVSKDTIKTWRRRGEVSMKYLTGFAKEHGLSLDYLRYGKTTPALLSSGERDALPPEVLSADERELLTLFRAAPLAVKAAAMGALQGAASTRGTRISVGGKVVGQVVEGDLVNQGPVVIGKNRGKKK